MFAEVVTIENDKRKILIIKWTEFCVNTIFMICFTNETTRKYHSRP